MDETPETWGETLDYAWDAAADALGFGDDEPAAAAAAPTPAPAPAPAKRPAPTKRPTPTQSIELTDGTPLTDTVGFSVDTVERVKASIDPKIIALGVGAVLLVGAGAVFYSRR